jgi:uncharacterized protein YceK
MKNKILIFTIVFSLSAALFSGCSSVKRHDDAVRIKPEAADKYQYHPYTDKKRDGKNLRGTVIKVQISSVPDSCFDGEPVSYVSKASVVFLDTMSAKDEQVEFIPIEDVILIGQVENLPLTPYNNINIFETFNNPDEFDALRIVPVDSAKIDTCMKRCDCEQFGIGLPEFRLECIKRQFDWFFVEMRGGYAVYTDKLINIPEYGREGWLGEIALGFRFGGLKEWGAGLAFSSGVPIYNSFDDTDVLRPTAMLHLRYQSPKDRFLGLCMRPFAYGQLGMAIDDLTVDLYKISMNQECRSNIDVSLPYIDFDMPISWGLGIGLDIPVATFLDLSIDAGIRSLSFGESLDGVNGFDNVPTRRSLNMFLLRFGLTY